MPAALTRPTREEGQVAPIWRGVFLETAYRFAGRAGGGVLSLFALHLIVGYLGSSQWGVFSAAAAWVGIFAVLGEFGVSTGAARDLPRAGERTSGILGATYVVGAAGAVVAMILAFLLGQGVYASHPEVRHLVALMLPSFPFVVAWVIAGTLLSANRRSDLRSVLDVLSSALLVVAALVVVHERAGASWYVVGTVAATAVTACAGIVMLRKLNFPAPRLRETWASLPDRVRSTRVIGIVVVAVMLYRYVDTVLLSVLSDSHQVGEYAIAYQLAGFVMSMPAFVLGTCVARYTAASSEGRRGLMRYLLNVLGGVVFPLCAVLAVLARPILDVVAGRAGRSALEPFVLLLVSTVFMWIASPFTAALVWSGAEKIAARITIAAFALNVIVNVSLDHALGATGAAIAMIASEIVSALLAGTIYCRRTKLRPRIAVPLAGVAAAALAIGVWAIVGAA